MGGSSSRPQQLDDQNIFEEYFPNWDAAMGDCFLSDTVGFSGDQSELISIGNGLLKPNEKWPREESNQDILQRSEILNRNPQAPHVTTFLVLISIQDLWNGSAEHDRIVKGLIETAKTKFEINGMPVEVPVMIAITKCDEHTTNPHFNNLLGQRNSDNLAPIFKKATERFGIPQDKIIAPGQQDGSDETDWSHDCSSLELYSDNLNESIPTENNRSVSSVSSVATKKSVLVNQWMYEMESEANCHDTDDRCSLQSFESTMSNASEAISESDFLFPHASISEVACRCRDCISASFDREMKASGLSSKDFLSVLTVAELVSILDSKGVPESILQVLVKNEYNGLNFVIDEFVEAAFDDTSNVAEEDLRRFVEIRNSLLSTS